MFQLTNLSVRTESHPQLGYLSPVGHTPLLTSIRKRDLSRSQEPIHITAAH